MTTIGEAKHEVELATYAAGVAADALVEAEKADDAAQKRLVKAIAAYTKIVGAEPGTHEAEDAEREHERDRAQAERLFIAAGKPVPAWLKPR